MKQQKKISLHFLATLVFLLTASGCSQQKKPSIPSNVPNGWYQIPEEQSQRTQKPSDPTNKKSEDSTLDTADKQKLDQLSHTVDSFFTVNTQALNQSSQVMNQMVSPQSHDPVPPGMPNDWVPWHAEIFTTDLTLSVGGLLGSLTGKGSPTVRAYWRKQGPVREQKVQNVEQVSATLSEDSDSQPVIAIDESTQTEELMHQMEPVIRAAAATGKVQDTPDLRNQLLTAAQEFQSVASVIPSTDPSLPWWVSRFRLDLTIDASGKVAPMGSVGGEVRFRFEWHRMMKHHHAQPQVQPLTARQATIKSSLAEFVTATAYDLDHSFDEISHLGFKAHTMRMGIGISAKGNVGIAKGSAGIVGQIYFTRNVQRPKVRPQSIDDEELDHPILMIERRPMMQHVLFAQQNQIPVKLNSTSENNPIEEAVYQVDRKAFRKGLKKAANIGQFFAERASKNSQSSGWKIYELRTSFDASISGELDLVTLAGAVTAQIAFFNENF